MIARCQFGSMIIGGKAYTSDLIIFADGRVVDNWWRRSGHRLTLEDIPAVLADKPDIIVVGTGISGMMRLASDVEAELGRQGIELVAERTQAAAETFNRLKSSSTKVAGCFHLTC